MSAGGGSARRILYVVNQTAYFRTHRLSLALAAAEAGYEVHVASPADGESHKLREEVPHWHSYPLDRASLNPLRELRTMIALVMLYRRVRPDLVHHVTVKPILYGSMAARMTGVPAVVNAVPGLGGSYASSRWRRWFVHSAMAVMYRIASGHPRVRFIFQNLDDLDFFVSSGWTGEDESVLIRGAGVDVGEFSSAEREPEPPVVILHARLVWPKGVDVFVEAARKLHDTGARFLLVGEPDEGNPAAVPLSRIRAWEKEGVIEYLGRRGDIPALLERSSIACLPSRYGEGLPRSLLEAAAAGLPIVTTDRRGCRDVVRSGVNGILVARPEAEEVAGALRTLLESPELRRKMGEEGRRLVEREFSFDQVRDRTLALYDELSGSIHQGEDAAESDERTSAVS